MKLTVVSAQGKEAVVAILGVDDFFGEGCIAGQARRMATVKPMADCDRHAARKDDHAGFDP